MTSLEEKLEGSYVRISPQGIDLSHFQGFQTTFEEHFFQERSAFGLRLEDEEGKHTELYGVFRPFHRRAECTKPLDLPAPLHDEGIHMTGSLMQYVEQFFHVLHSIDPQTERTQTHVWEGPFKKVTVTQRMPGRNWWKAMFIDLYSNSEEVHRGILTGMDRSSRRALAESDIWKRYEIARRYIRALEEERPNFREERKIIEEEAQSFLLRHGSYMKPHLMRNPRDYTYLLLGFHKAEIDIDVVHKAATRLFAEERTLQQAIADFKDRTRNLRLEIPYLKQKYKIFGKEMTLEALNEAYDYVSSHGTRMRSPITVSNEVAALQFLVLERRRWKKMQQARRSYALLRIHPSRQTALPFKEEGVGGVGLEEEDFSPRKEPIWDLADDANDITF